MLNAFVYYIHCLNDEDCAHKHDSQRLSISSIPAHYLCFILFDVNLRTVMLFV